MLRQNGNELNAEAMNAVRLASSFKPELAQERRVDGWLNSMVPLIQNNAVDGLAVGT